MIKAFPKIFQLGTKYIDTIFEDEVEISEKIDGSMFAFGKINNELFIRSKGKQLFFDNPEKLFQEGVEYIESIQNKIPNNHIFYAEYLKKPKHSCLAYDRIPKNHLILFGVCSEKEVFSKNLEEYAKLLDIESVPILFKGKINNSEELLKYLELTSILGGQKIEGVVVKNYNKTVLVGGQVMPIMNGKYVSEAFKEVHNKNWKKDNTGKGKFETFVESFKTDARWNKAIIHLKEKGELEETPRDIGKLMKEVKEDIIKEEKENIKDFLYKTFSGQILRTAVRGFPIWYKEKLLKENIDE